uniref:Uncharacterized protein n=1 Tax=Tanacetum cinerariifolium TaxID=118510 RepID=A0A6L2J393_TANCI|nr:hypothetical protein [Tanacetum cinerariifolium]
MQNLKDSSDPIIAMNMELALIAKEFKVNTIPTKNNQRSSLIPHNSQIIHPGMNTSQDIKIQMVYDNVGDQVRHNVVQNDGNEYGNGNVKKTLAEGNGNGITGNPIRCYNCQGEGIQSTQEEFEFMATVDSYEETERVKVNYTLEDTLQQASTSGTQSNNAPVYDSDGSTESVRLQAQLGDLKGIPTASDEFPLPEYFPTASEEMFPLLSLRDAPAEEVCTADEVKD